MRAYRKSRMVSEPLNANQMVTVSPIPVPPCASPADLAIPRYISALFALVKLCSP